MTTNPILLKYFERQGFDAAFFEQYEQLCDTELKGLPELAAALYQIYCSGETVVLMTDFDGDGIMSGIIGYAGLSELGIKAELYKPHPEEGYGIRPADIDRVRVQYPHARYILTADVGISEHTAIAYAQSLGYKVFVTDHHPGSKPNMADIVVDPLQLGETFPHSGICGAYVLWRVLDYYARSYCTPVKQVDIFRLRLFAGIATVSDIMPLLYENRQLVRDSVAIARYFFSYDISNNTLAPPNYSWQYSCAFVGMIKLLHYFAEQGKISNAESIDETFYGFYLAPMLNSAKRMDGDMRGVYDIFFCPAVEPVEGHEDMACMTNAISYLHILNQSRKDETDKYMLLMQSRIAEMQAGHLQDEAMEAQVYITDARGGICGLLASKLMHEFNLPVLVVRRREDGSYAGSGRSPEWYPFRTKTTGTVFPDRKESFAAGHEYSFGVRFANDEELKQYIAFFKSSVLKEFEQMMQYVTSDAYKSDDIVLLADDSIDVPYDFDADVFMLRECLQELEQYHPLGKGFPVPEFKLIVPCNIRAEYFGFSKDGGAGSRTYKHVRLVTDSGLEIPMFNKIELYQQLVRKNKEGKPFVIRGRLSLNKWGGRETIQLFADEIGILE